MRTEKTASLTRISCRGNGRKGGWGLLFILPWLVIFLLFVLYPMGRGLLLGSDPASYRELAANPIYFRTLGNTVLFLLVAVNLKMALSLFLSGFFVSPVRWVRWTSVLFILPWALPSVPVILSFRFMLNSEWGMVNSLLFHLGIDGPLWLVKPAWGLFSIILVHVWKFLPYWVIVMTAARLSIPGELYDVAALNGADLWQRFRHVTWPGLRRFYWINTLVAFTWALGDFNSVYLLTGGGPIERTHTLATLGFRYAFVLGDMKTAVATVLTIMPLLLPVIVILVRRMKREVAL